jgi:hypothetical protein
MKDLILLLFLGASTFAFAGEMDKKAGGCFATITAMLDRKVQINKSQSNFMISFVEENRPRLISIADKVAVCGNNLTKSCVTKYINQNDFDFLSEFSSVSNTLISNFYATDPRAPDVPYWNVAWGANCLAFFNKFK